MPTLTTITRASGTVTSGVIANGETVTVAGKVYTFQDSLTNVDGNVKRGASDDASVANLTAAINLGAGAGTAYAALMTKNAHVYAAAAGLTPTIMTVTAKVPGVIGNFLPLAEGTTGAVISGALLTGGVGNIYTAINEIRQLGQINSDVLTTLDVIDEQLAAGA